MPSERHAAGERIRDLRARKLWNQQTLARKAKVSVGTLNRIENDAEYAANTDIVTQEKIARALGVPRDVIFPVGAQKADA